MITIVVKKIAMISDWKPNWIE